MAEVSERAGGAGPPPPRTRAPRRRTSATSGPWARRPAPPPAPRMRGVTQGAASVGTRGARGSIDSRPRPLPPLPRLPHRGLQCACAGAVALAGAAEWGGGREGAPDWGVGGAPGFPLPPRGRRCACRPSPALANFAEHSPVARSRAALSPPRPCLGPSAASRSRAPRCGAPQSRPPARCGAGFELGPGRGWDAYVSSGRVELDQRLSRGLEVTSRSLFSPSGKAGPSPSPKILEARYI